MITGEHAHPGSMTDEGKYRAFLLGCWQEPGAGPGGKPAWRITLVEVDDEDGKRGFASLEELNTFLREDLERDTVQCDLRKDKK